MGHRRSIGRKSQRPSGPSAAWLEQSDNTAPLLPRDPGQPSEDTRVHFYVPFWKFLSPSKGANGTPDGERTFEGIDLEGNVNVTEFNSLPTEVQSPEELCDVSRVTQMVSWCFCPALRLPCRWETLRNHGELWVQILLPAYSRATRDTPHIS